MKRIVCISLICSCALWAGPICDQKRDMLAKKMEFAKQSDNPFMLQRIQVAIASVEKYCDDDAVIHDAKKTIAKLQNKILDKKEEIAENQAKGKLAKVQKKQFELGVLEAELQEYKDELSQYESLL